MIVIFDFGGVLTVHSSAFSEILLPTLTEQKIPFQYRKLKRLWSEYSSGKRSIEKEISRVVPKDIEEKAMAKVRLDKDVFPILRYLKRRGHRAAILSNAARKWANFMLKKFQLRKRFRPVLFSGHHGFRKPDVRFYKIFLKRAKARPSECIYIDNKLENLVPAHKIGMKTVLCAKQEKAKKPRWCDYIIKNLNQLKEIL